MSYCEFCGKEGELVGAFVESVKFNVCSNCKKHGKVVEEIASKKFEKKDIRREEVIYVVLDNSGELIKLAREKKGFTQHDLAIKLNEKESIIAKIEQGSLKPSIDLAKKLEKFFSVGLLQWKR